MDDLQKDLIMHFICLISLPLLLLFTTASAGVYKWTDAAGNIHYGSKPPDTAKSLQELKFADQPNVNNGDKGGLRPGELRMLKSIERKRERAANARRQRIRQEAKENHRRALEKAKISEKCDALETRIDEIQGQLRQGYSASQGLNLNRTRREIAAKIYRYCK